MVNVSSSTSLENGIIYEPIAEEAALPWYADFQLITAYTAATRDLFHMYSVSDYPPLIDATWSQEIIDTVRREYHTHVYLMDAAKLSRHRSNIGVDDMIDTYPFVMAVFRSGNGKPANMFAAVPLTRAEAELIWAFTNPRVHSDQKFVLPVANTPVRSELLDNITTKLHNSGVDTVAMTKTPLTFLGEEEPILPEGDLLHPFTISSTVRQRVVELITPYLGKLNVVPEPVKTALVRSLLLQEQEQDIDERELEALTDRLNIHLLEESNLHLFVADSTVFAYSEENLNAEASDNPFTRITALTPLPFIVAALEDPQLKNQLLTRDFLNRQVDSVVRTIRTLVDLHSEFGNDTKTLFSKLVQLLNINPASLGPRMLVIKSSCLNPKPRFIETDGKTVVMNTTPQAKLLMYADYETLESLRMSGALDRIPESDYTLLKEMVTPVDINGVNRYKSMMGLISAESDHSLESRDKIKSRISYHVSKILALMHRNKLGRFANFD